MSPLRPGPGEGARQRAFAGRVTGAGLGVIKAL